MPSLTQVSFLCTISHLYFLPLCTCEGQRTNCRCQCSTLWVLGSHSGSQVWQGAPLSSVPPPLHPGCCSTRVKAGESSTTEIKPQRRSSKLLTENLDNELSGQKDLALPDSTRENRNVNQAGLSFQGKRCNLFSTQKTRNGGG